MRLKLAFLPLVVVSLVAASAAVAKDHPGNGNPSVCKPSVTVLLKGVLAPDVDPLDGDASFVMMVKHTNKHGRAYETAGTATILVDTKTRIRRQGAHNLGSLAPNDRVSVKAKACKADLKNGGTPDLTGRKVDAHPVTAPSKQCRGRRRPTWTRAPARNGVYSGVSARTATPPSGLAQRPPLSLYLAVPRRRSPVRIFTFTS